MAFLRNFGLALLLLAAFALAWLYGRANDPRETFTAKRTDKIVILDGDSFRLGNKAFRLEAIDAPEYRQSCQDRAGAPWECGKASRASLETILRAPGLACQSRAQDGFRRALAICKTDATPDIGAAQVFAGMAVSDKFNGIRSYAREEDAAKTAARGIWQGSFIHPKEWRDANPRKGSASNTDGKPKTAPNGN